MEPKDGLRGAQEIIACCSGKKHLGCWRYSALGFVPPNASKASITDPMYTMPQWVSSHDGGPDPAPTEVSGIFATS